MSKDPAAAANTWYSKNQATLKTQGLEKYKVGSWAAVMTVNLKKNDLFDTAGLMKNVYNAHSCLGTGVTGAYGEDFVPTATTDVCGDVGTAGDFWAVTVHQTTTASTAKADTIQHGSFITTKAVTTAGSYAKQVYAVSTKFKANSIPTLTKTTTLADSGLKGTKNTAVLVLTTGSANVTSGDANENVYTAFRWDAMASGDKGTTQVYGAETVCDIKKWAAADACYGITTW